MVETKKRLGRGLDSLLSATRLRELDEAISQPPIEVKDRPDISATVAQIIADNKVMSLTIESITRNPHQPRQSFAAQKLLELAESIKANGLIQPILVRPMGQGYQLIAGERRLKATEMAGKKTIQAIVRNASEEQMIEWALIENIHRADLNPLERANAYKNYVTNFSLSQQEASQRLGEDRSTIANYMRLLELPEEIKQMLSENQLSMGHARALLGLESQQQKLQLARQAVKQKLSVRDLERAVQNLNSNQQSTSKSKSDKSGHILELEQELSRSLGTKVLINTIGRKGHRGRIIIDFYNLDEFDRIKEKLS
jgi:ParB family transcriptional regulator, chromosome partitioning protein